MGAESATDTTEMVDQEKPEAASEEGTSEPTELDVLREQAAKAQAAAHATRKERNEARNRVRELETQLRKYQTPKAEEGEKPKPKVSQPTEQTDRTERERQLESELEHARRINTMTVKASQLATKHGVDIEYLLTCIEQDGIGPDDDLDEFVETAADEFRSMIAKHAKALGWTPPVGAQDKAEASRDEGKPKSHVTDMDRRGNAPTATSQAQCLSDLVASWKAVEAATGRQAQDQAMTRWLKVKSTWCERGHAPQVDEFVRENCR